MPAHARSGHCARANRVFGTDEKRIRAENTALEKGKSGLAWFLSKFYRHSSMHSLSCMQALRSARFMANEHDMILRILTEAHRRVHRSGSGRAKKTNR